MKHQKVGLHTLHSWLSSNEDEDETNLRCQGWFSAVEIIESERQSSSEDFARNKDDILRYPLIHK